MSEIITKVITTKKQIIIMAIFTGIISGIGMVSTWFYSYLIDQILPEHVLELPFSILCDLQRFDVLCDEFSEKKKKKYYDTTRLL